MTKKTAVATAINPKQDEQPKDVYAAYTPAQLKAQLRKAERVIARQEHMSKAGKAVERLLENADFKVLMTHFESTVTRMTLDAPQRQNPESRAQDALITQSIAVVLDMIETLPEVGETMAKNVVDTRTAAINLKAKL
ncbi:hypothetical protein NVP1188A_46 [Vibrio phage 1.188.A._10N.286.51.A6]|uniref:Uncharacterized protein n=4 Tax=Mukerjeevirus TaxID=2733146 RepID=A0A2I7REQ9_9CAUD|nr:hypothetical protein HOU76_gp26 [Vibrio phage 1.169.O._10N.261.52.B1]YP_009817505.1 hypothetical protein HOU77_gp60 [Vibrio phage 1.188.A._10N.286.51.A6]AUR93700.1 hypothetical protein NVP1188B_46 [Vibrio phage 1.188.B._10N.286.51.A6]AUR93786.1 hypothetical protein NVP1188C_46 [Vibrio phage 1.188.C._10N.286.51.A6]AUR92101.1 hypothetical protein NVP1169O_73 [Vibrio phage 1.169.O._10N.261.52.B1]AUR93614.1 hypothetical protein NVP1188A_46 [Vibrio phage 1.188.A._10N.286.51.A6]